MKNAYITQSTDGDWACLCGNQPWESGFYPCDAAGNEVDPTPTDWTTNWYVCAQCGRIIDQDTLKVVKIVDINTIAARNES